jgi:hypothetical protein
VRSGHAGSLTDGLTAATHYSYFAEGTTGHGFQESLALFNPANADANVTLNLLPSTGGPPIVKTYSIGPIRRSTVNVNALAPNRSFGVQIISDVELAVERTLTFGANQNGMTTVAAVSMPATTWYFAEGSTRNGFSEFITLLNPAGPAASVTTSLVDPHGRQIGAVTKIVQPGTRATIDVGKYVSATSVGAVVTSTLPILAERTMYRGDLQSANVVGAGSFGRSALSPGYEFPSGDTSPGKLEFLLLLNPNNTPLTIAATFYPLTGGVPIGQSIVVPAHSRVTLNVARDVPNLPKGQHGVIVRSGDSTSTFVAEQSLYSSGFKSAVTTTGVPLALSAPPS